MSLEEALIATAKNFVRPAFQQRFVHDGLKKPSKLMTRISHQIANVFDDRFKNGSCRYKPENECFLFQIGGNPNEMLWHEAMAHIEKQGGGGYLVVDRKGERFYARSEGYPPKEVFAGDI
jgi:hypothetical protein